MAFGPRRGRADPVSVPEPQAPPAAKRASCPFCGEGSHFESAEDGRPVSRCERCGRWSGDGDRDRE